MAGDETDSMAASGTGRPRPGDGRGAAPRTERRLLRWTVAGVLLALLASLAGLCLSLYLFTTSGFNDARQRCEGALTASLTDSTRLASEYYGSSQSVPTRPPGWAAVEGDGEQVISACFTKDLIPPGSELAGVYSVAWPFAMLSWAYMASQSTDPSGSMGVRFLEGWGDWCSQALAYVQNLPAPPPWPWRGPSGHPTYSNSEGLSAVGGA
jgi:hypothetical protein